MTHVVKCLSFFLQDHEWEVVEKPAQSSPQVSRKDETSSLQGKPHPEPPTSLPSSPAKKKESVSATPEGTRWLSGAFRYIILGFPFCFDSFFSKWTSQNVRKIDENHMQKTATTEVKIKNTRHIWARRDFKKCFIHNCVHYWICDTTMQLLSFS